MIQFVTNSDDCASLTLDGAQVGPVDEAWGYWLPLLVDGQQVGEVLVSYGDGWEFKIQAVAGHTVTLDPSPLDRLDAE